MRLEEFVAFDEAASQRISQYAGNRIIHKAAWLIARTGDSLIWFIISAFLIWQMYPLGWPLLITVAVTALSTAVVKGIFRRERPSEKWAIATDKYAFPSGHAARAGAVAWTLAFAFPQYAALCFLWAALVAVARVILARHYISDVAGGLLFGIFVSGLLKFIL